MANDPANRCAAQCSQRATAEYRAANGTRTGTYGGAAFLLRHAGTAA